MNKIVVSIMISLIMQTGPVSMAQTGIETPGPRITTENGVIEGINDSGVLTFKGIPFAQPPVDELRWKPPQPVKDWNGIKETKKFGPQAMQRPIFGDMVFRSDGMSEDCLYLNVWTPTSNNNEGLPVLVYFYGGGFLAGDGSEPRYDGENMARTEGIVTVTVNYRLNVFGFMTHPELTEESPYNASGNYGLMDQAQALKWIHQNIAAFGGDPDKITIAGESAGSMSVNAQMASPMARDLIAGAVGESGSLLGTLPAVPLDEGEKMGMKFQELLAANSLEELRAMPAEKILEVTAREEAPRSRITVDGRFFPKPPVEIYRKGKQADVPLLAGWNSAESNYNSLLGEKEPTPKNYKMAVANLYGENAEKILELYPGTTREEVMESATALAGDRFIGFSTWKWCDIHAETSNSPVYRYFYTHPRPPMASEDNTEGSSADRGAVHSAEIEYVMGNLPTNKVYDWAPDDFQVSRIFKGYVANFVKTGNPNGLGLPQWSNLQESDPPKVMHIDVNTRLLPDNHHKRYEFLDQLNYPDPE